MGKMIPEAIMRSAEAMLKSRATTGQVMDELGISASTIQKIRNKLKKEGYDHYWHPNGGYISKKIRV